MKNVFFLFLAVELIKKKKREEEKLVRLPTTDSTNEKLVTVSVNGEECTYDVVHVLEDEHSKKR